MNQDQQTVRLVLGGLLAITALVVCAGVMLALRDKSLSDALIAMGSTALGAVASFLVSTRTRSSE